MTSVVNLEESLKPETRVEENAPYVGFLNVLLFCGTLFIMGFVNQHLTSIPIEEAQPAAVSQAQPLVLADELAILKEELESEFAPITDLRDFQVVQKGEYLEVQFSTGDIFASGSADLDGLASDMLGELARFMLPRTGGYMVELEGHTDDLPMAAKTWKFPSNWELSSARASSVLHVFVDNGLRESSMRVSSRGRFEPKYPNKDAAGKPIRENRLKNRRLVVRIGDPY